MTLQSCLILAAALFSLGVVAVVARQNAIGTLIGIELILNSANLNFVAFSRFSSHSLDGHVFAIFVIILAACEAAVALAILINVFATFGDIDVDGLDSMKR
ncbi:MAG: NADH-quinone oxidoreductase subunit NuoK [Candidatus Sumerlaeia bacterium]